jgi:asparagine synthase (glutamine-hydrolysing)
MCGIFGAIALERTDSLARLSDAQLRALLGVMRNRGPDGEGLVRLDDVVLGHRRLAITDLDNRASQPMTDSTRNCWITYNGFIQNYQVLRQELQHTVQLRTSSDTEVILELFARDGLDAMARLKGMFAFAFFDSQSRVLHLVRDRFGVKPLYYAQFAGLLVFASDLRAILRFPGFSPQLSSSALSAFLSYRQPLGCDNFFEGIREVPPAGWLRVEDGRIDQGTYWSLSSKLCHGVSLREASANIETLLAASVHENQLGDVPHAIFLSGGLDSSALLAEANQTSPPNCITASFPYSSLDEADYAKQVTEVYGAPLHIVEINESGYAAASQSWASARDTPPAMHNEAGLLELSRASRKFARVVLCGEGADEIFGGYGRLFRSPFDWARQGVLQCFPQPLRNMGLSLLGLEDVPKARNRAEFFLSRYSYFPWNEKAPLLRSDVRTRVEFDSVATGVISRAFNACAALPFQSAIGRIMLGMHLPPLLRAVDSTTMFHGVEARVPYLDHELVEYAMSLPPHLHLAWKSRLHALLALRHPADRISERYDNTKVALREAYRRRLPAAVVKRLKAPFPVPLRDWAISKGGQHRWDALFDREFALGTLLDPDALKRWYVTQSREPTEMFGRQAWMIVHLETWMRSHA